MSSVGYCVGCFLCFIAVFYCCGLALISFALYRVNSAVIAQLNGHQWGAFSRYWPWLGIGCMPPSMSSVVAGGLLCQCHCCYWNQQSRLVTDIAPPAAVFIESINQVLLLDIAALNILCLMILFSCDWGVGGGNTTIGNGGNPISGSSKQTVTVTQAPECGSQFGIVVQIWLAKLKLKGLVRR